MTVTARLLKEVCHDVRVEPQLLPITGEELKEATANKSSEARPDISAKSVWLNDQKAFLNVRVFNPLAEGDIFVALSRLFISFFISTDNHLHGWNFTRFWIKGSCLFVTFNNTSLKYFHA